MSTPISKLAFAATSVGTRLAHFAIERRPVGPRDVLIEIDYCGVCHTDLHFVNNDWGVSYFPIVPSHEIIGQVVSMGARVVMITTSPHKGEDARRLGADDVLLSTDGQAMATWTGTFDSLLNTIPVPHDFNT